MAAKSISELFNVKDQVVVVTGGGGVLCGAMAECLGRNGVKVAVLDLRDDAAQTVAGQVTAAGGEAIAVACNVLERDSLEAARRTVLDAFGRIDTLINGAGGNNPKATCSMEWLTPERFATPGEDTSFFDLDPSGVSFVFALNFVGTLLPSQVFGEPMAAAGAGTIVNVSSMNAFTPLTKIAAYSAAKAAVSNFTQWLAVHLAPVGIRVNALAPGFFLTDQNRFLLVDKATGQATARGQKIIDHTPMGRYGQPEELLGALLWLMSPAASFVTGTVVPIDGGFAAYSGV